MQVVDMISWQDGDKYPDCDEQENFDDFCECVKKYIIKHNLRVSGFEYQRSPQGIPLIEFNGQKYAFRVSLRVWGGVMAEALEPNNKSPYAYCTWAWFNPDKERPR